MSLRAGRDGEEAVEIKQFTVNRVRDTRVKCKQSTDCSHLAKILLFLILIK